MLDMQTYYRSYITLNITSESIHTHITNSSILSGKSFAITIFKLTKCFVKTVYMIAFAKF